MKNFETNWTKEELQVYLLIYCANADFVETKEEIDFIKSNYNIDSYEKIHSEFKADNDYTRIQKIRFTLEKYCYSKEECEKLMEEMKSLFLSDGKYDTLEKNLMIGLKHIIG